MLDIVAAAQATCKYTVGTDSRLNQYTAAGEYYGTRKLAQDACDRLNLQAVLDAIRNPSTEMIKAGTVAKQRGRWDAGIYRAMIEALIAEVQND